jgi:hypothetical protein
VGKDSGGPLNYRPEISIATEPPVDGWCPASFAPPAKQLMNTSIGGRRAGKLREDANMIAGRQAESGKIRPESTANCPNRQLVTSVEKVRCGALSLPMVKRYHSWPIGRNGMPEISESFATAILK